MAEFCADKCGDALSNIYNSLYVLWQYGIFLRYRLTGIQAYILQDYLGATCVGKYGEVYDGNHVGDAPVESKQYVTVKLLSVKQRIFIFSSRQGTRMKSLRHENKFSEIGSAAFSYCTNKIYFIYAFCDILAINEQLDNTQKNVALDSFKIFNVKGKFVPFLGITHYMGHSFLYFYYKNRFLSNYF